MTQRVRPYSLKSVIAIGVAVALVSTLISAFLLYRQAHSVPLRAAGEVVAITPDQIRIRDRWGEVVTLMVPPDTDLRGIDSLSDLRIGQHVMSGGRPISEGVIEIERLRALGN